MIGRIFREWRGISDRSQSLFNQFWMMAIVCSEEGFQGCSACLVQLFERWPTGQKIAEQDRPFVLEPIMGQRVVMFQIADQAIDDSPLIINDLAPLLKQHGQLTDGRALRLQGF